MAWLVETIRGVETIIGHIGDPLVIKVDFDFEWAEEADPIDFTGHTWICQARHTIPGDVVGEFTMLDETVEIDTEARTSTVTLLFRMDETSVFDDSVEYVYGVRAVAGTYAPWTGIAADPIIGYLPTPRQETP